MAYYNKKEAYQNNYAVIQEIFDANKQRRVIDRQILKKYSAYGALKEVLLPLETKSNWPKSTLKFYEDVKALKDLIYQNLPEDRAKKMFDNIKSNALTSFYTDQRLIQPILDNLKIEFQNEPSLRILEPSCGDGRFFNSIQNTFSDKKVHAVGFDIDPLASFISQKLHPTYKVNNSGFQTINKGDYEPESFDLVCSNIPFGDFKIFDPIFADSKDQNRIDSQKKIHNYFFVKSLDQLKREGYLAFYTSTGVMDSPSNMFLREHLMKESQLISALRLPNTAFQGSAGTEVVSDLIVLKKRISPLKSLDDLTPEEKDFISSDNHEIEHEESFKTFPLNRYYINKPEAILGKLSLDKFHAGREILSVHPSLKTEDLDKLSFEINSSLKKDLANSNKNKQNQVEELNDDKDFVESVFKHHRLELIKISNKAFAVAGDTKPIKDFLNIDLKAIWRRNEKAWMLPESRREASIAKLYEFLKDRPNDIMPQAIFQASVNLSQTGFSKDLTTIVVSPENVEKLELIPGNLFYAEGKVGKLKKDGKGGYELDIIKLSAKNIEAAKSLIDLRISYKQLRTLLNNQFDDQAEKQRQLLNIKYDEFVEKHGHINDFKFKRIIDNEIEFFKLLSFERKEKDKIIKADFLNQNVSQKYLEVKIETLEEAILSSLNKYAKVDIDYISKTLNKSGKEIVKEGKEKGLLFANPQIPKTYKYNKPVAWKTIPYHWTTKDEFLSGNIRDKIAFYEFLSKDDKNDVDYLQKASKLLNDVCPPYLDIQLISPNLGEAWVDKNIQNAFATDLFKKETKLSYISSSDKYEMQIKGWSNESWKTYAIEKQNGRRIDGQQVFNYVINDISPEITYTLNEKKYKDKKAMDKFERLSKEIKTKFKEFIYARHEYVSQLEPEYNHLYNQAVKRDFDGSHLSFPGFNYETIQPYKHQKDAAWMMIQNNGGIADHIVGAGKTFLMAMMAMELKRLGLSKKTMLLAKPANMEAIVEDFQLVYPDAKILHPQKNETDPHHQKAFFEKIANNDWDCVVITHSQFEKIRQSEELKAEIIQEEIDLIEKDLGALTDKPSKQEQKGLEVRKRNLEAELEANFHALKEDPDVLRFDQMGIEHLLVDESHEFKNLMFSTRHQNISGLSTSKTVKKTLKLLTAIRGLQKHHKADQGVTFLSGTVISNSLAELYLLFKYLRPNKLKELKIESFDGWAKVFAQKSSEYEFDVNGQVKKKTRFRTFEKVPELVKLYSEIAHVVTDKNFKVDKPELETELVAVDPTPAQLEYNKDLLVFAKTGNADAIGMGHLSEKQLLAKMLIVTNQGKKMSLDMRMIDPSYTEEDSMKIHSLAEKINYHYQKFDSDRGTQLVFSDSGVPTGKDFNLYQACKDILVDQYNIPEKEIQFIHDNDTKTKKKKLLENTKKGNTRIVFGSTGKLGTGTNVQDRITALHNLDIPWKPSEIDQRNGRGGRQGNWLAKQKNDNKVNTYFYATKQTLDSYKFCLNSIKKNFIDQIKDESITSRKITEVDSDGALSYSEFMAVTSGNPDLLEKAKLEKQLSSLQDQQNSITYERLKDQQEFQRAGESIINMERAIKRLNKDMDSFSEVYELAKSHLIIDENVIEKPKEIGEKLQEKVEANRHLNSGFGIVELGKLNDDYKLKLDPMSMELKVYSEKSGLSYGYGQFYLPENPIFAGQYVRKCIEKIPSTLEGTTKRLERTKREHNALELELQKKPDDFSVEISQMEMKIRKLETAIDEKNKEHDENVVDSKKGKDNDEEIAASKEIPKRRLKM